MLNRFKFMHFKLLRVPCFPYQQVSVALMKGMFGNHRLNWIGFALFKNSPSQEYPTKLRFDMGKVR